MASSRVGPSEFNGPFLLKCGRSRDNLSAAIPLKKMGSPVNKLRKQWLGEECGHGPSLGPGGSAQQQQQQQQQAPEWGLYMGSWLASQEYSHFARIHTKEKGLSKFRALILLVSAVLVPASGTFSGVMSHPGQRAQHALFCTQYFLCLITPESYSTNGWVHRSHRLRKDTGGGPRNM